MNWSCPASPRSQTATYDELRSRTHNEQRSLLLPFLPGFAAFPWAAAYRSGGGPRSASAGAPLVAGGALASLWGIGQIDATGEVRVVGEEPVEQLSGEVAEDVDVRRAAGAV